MLELSHCLSSVCKQTHKLSVSAKIILIGVGNLSQGLMGVKQHLIHCQTFYVISDPKPPLFWYAGKQFQTFDDFLSSGL